MVYTGKPSTGCLNCRKRHIKCDEARPHCRACVRTGRECPGYPHPLDVMLRDRTAFKRKKRTVSNDKSTQAKGDVETSLSPPSSASSMAVSPVKSSSSSPVTSAVVRNPPLQIPGSLSLPLEDTIPSFFFNSYLTMPKDPLIRIGYMELLPQSYTESAPDSHIHLGVLAVSFFCAAAWTGHRSLLRSAEQFCGKAIARTRAALQGNVNQNLDSILMAVLLLSTYEEFSAMKEKRFPNKAHLHGAIALVNTRPVEDRDSPHSQTLANAVQTQIIRTSMGLAYPMAQTPKVRPLPLPTHQSASSRLISVTSELVNLRQAWDRSTLSSARDTDDLKAILVLANNLDLQLSAWEHILPAHWTPVPATNIPPSVREAGLFKDRCDCYSDLWVASTWSFYRDSRIVVQNIILNCLRLLPDLTSPDELQSRIKTIQNLATDICATVPFFIGSQTVSAQMNPHIEYPEAEGRRITPAHLHTAPLLGGWFVISYLVNLWSPELCLGEEQRAWIQEQMQRVLRIYTFASGSGGGGGGGSWA